MTNALRIAILGVTVVVLAITFVVLSGGEETDTGDVRAETTPTVSTTQSGTSTSAQQTEPAPAPEPETPEIVVRDGQPAGGPERIEIESGTQGTFVVRSEGTPDEEVHLHGYDIEKALPSGGKATFTFEADAEGVFEIELHGSAVEIGQLRVVPG